MAEHRRKDVGERDGRRLVSQTRAPSGLRQGARSPAAHLFQSDYFEDRRPADQAQGPKRLTRAATVTVLREAIPSTSTGPFSISAWRSARPSNSSTAWR